MTERVSEIIAAIQRLSARELVELNRRLRDDPGTAGIGARLSPRTPPPPPPLMADAEDRSVKGRTIAPPPPPSDFESDYIGKKATR